MSPIVRRIPSSRSQLTAINFFSSLFSCRTKNTTAESKDHFQKILQAYETLRDPAKRIQYDALKSINFEDPFSGASASGRPEGTPYGPWSARPGHNPTMDEWERQFDEWIKKMNNQYGENAADTERIRKERASAERRSRAAAWEREKREAFEVKARSTRLRRRAETAKHIRHATILRKFWQGRTVFTWQDAAVGAAFLCTSIGLAYHWKTNILSSFTRTTNSSDDTDNVSISTRSGQDSKGTGGLLSLVGGT